MNCICLHYLSTHPPTYLPTYLSVCFLFHLKTQQMSRWLYEIHDTQ